ncbi:MAG: hypothetical protein ABIJ65_15330 [Chloroflexota bacterium]
MNKQLIKHLPVLFIAIVTLACGSVQVGLVTPTSVDLPGDDVNIQDPAATSVGTDQNVEDYSSLWVEYWDPRYNYGVALPSHWVVNPTPTDSVGGGSMSARNYTNEYRTAYSVKGNWVGGEPPEGVVALEFVAFEGVLPEQSVEVAINSFLGGEQSVILSVDEVTIGRHLAYQVNEANINDSSDTWHTFVFRIKPEIMLLVVAYPQDRIELADVQAILGSISFSKSEPITKPKIAPFPPLVIGDIPVLPTSTPLPEGACDPGNLSTAEDMQDALSYNLETGNYSPFSYMMGNPFVIGYWAGEGVSLSREEALDQLKSYYLPSPENVVNITDPALFPDLGNVNFLDMWDPKVDVVAALYSQGWGADGLGEAMLAIARCSQGGNDSYYWYGVIIAGAGFDIY